MKSKYPQRYEEGELSATRKRLGNLSEAEAKKYADMLGGEIGIEKRSSENPEADSADDGSAALEKEKPSEFLSASKRKKIKVPYLQRIKIDFLCSAPEYRLKTRANAYVSIVPFLFPERDYVHPFFLTHAEDLFYTNIENLVMAVRALLAVASYTKIIVSLSEFHMEILTAIACWNIEGIHLEIVRLRQHPKRKHVKTLRSLIRSIYLPIIRLSSIEDITDLHRAVRSMYSGLVKLGIISGKAERLKTYYEVAAAELSVVFGGIKHALYPLIMKVCETRFYSYGEIFSSALDEVMISLTIQEKQIIKKEAFPLPQKDEGLEEAENQEIETDVEKISEFLLFPRYAETKLFVHGNNIIEALFPRCGWHNENEETDFYTYFESILQYPKGTELLAPHGTLIRVITLTLIIQELLQGFRGIEFGVIRDENENPIGVSSEISVIMGNWYRYGDEIVGKQYIPMLQEYCRNIQQDIRFRGSEYGKRLFSELNWTVKHYFLPYLIFNAERGTRPPAEASVDPLPDLVTRFLSILSALVKDNSDPSEEVTDSVKNPRLPFYFEIENIVSKRLRTILERHSLPFDNIVLIDTVYLLLKLLDEIVNNPLSDGYAENQSRLYRNAGDPGLTPVYTVEGRDTINLLAEEEEDDTSAAGES